MKETLYTKFKKDSQSLHSTSLQLDASTPQQILDVEKDWSISELEIMSIFFCLSIAIFSSTPLGAIYQPYTKLLLGKL